MAIASGASRGLAYGVQTARGTAATTTTLLRTAGAGQDLKNNQNRLAPASIREDGQPNAGAMGTHSSSATVPVNIAYGDYDGFMAAALRQKPTAWPASPGPYMLNFGTDLTYWTLEDRFTDIGQYIVYKDMVLNTMKVTAAQSDSGAYVTGEFSFIGTTRTISGTQIATPAAAGTTTPVTACGGVVSIGGVAVATVTSFDFTVDNGLGNVFVLGQCGAYDVSKGEIKVTGSLSVLFEDATYITDVDNNTDLDIKLVLTDEDANTITFEFPAANLTSDSLSGGTKNLVLALPFEAHYDATATTTLKISHS